MFESKEIFKNNYQTRMIERYGRSLEESHITEKYIVLGEMVRDAMGVEWKKTKETIAKNQGKQVYYFSMEFLLGRLLSNNLLNMGVYETVKEGLAELGVDLGELEEMEADAGLGNGGLGRLAACFVDSAASCGYAMHGNSIRYEYGLFRQLIQDGYQVEVPDQWLALGNVWEVRKPKHGCDVAFYGHIEEEFRDGKLYVTHKDATHVRAVPYDVPVVGANNEVVNTLRLWSAEASNLMPAGTDFRTYITEVNEICQNVYPDDSNEHGKYLRLKQQYFFVSAGLQEIIKAHLRVYPTLDNLPDKIAIQLNDTHPTMCVPELMRLLMDEHGYGWDEAWDITTRTLSYTNHTVMSEALEKWPVEYFQKLLPRIHMIIQEINRRTLAQMYADHLSMGDIYQMTIIRDGIVHMANLAVHGSHHVNGVARIHTDILKADVLKEFYGYYPEKFQNKTNGITQRRWLFYSNPQLTDLLDRTIGTEYHTDFNKIEMLMDHVDDENVQNEYASVKRQRKEILAKYIMDKVGVEVDPDSIFDVQAKRLHAYKRQTLNILHAIYLYQRMKKDPSFRIYPRTFIFAAKAAPSYVFAKKVIKLINEVGRVVNNDPEISKYLKVVFLPNYSVSMAEVLLNAADVSEQISTAGKEASGTGNMKFMMNGAITLGTLDGAVVEIDELIGRENDVIFGHTVEELNEMRPTYSAFNYYNSDENIRNALNSLVDGTFSSNPSEFKVIFDELLYKNDEFFVLADFVQYCEAQEKIDAWYHDQKSWRRSALINIAKSAYFSSDRTIKEYAEQIWGIHPITK